jgi:hypothetical protein
MRAVFCRLFRATLAATEQRACAYLRDVERYCLTALPLRATSGQDLRDGVWPLLAALLPRTAALQVTALLPPSPSSLPLSLMCASLAAAWGLGSGILEGAYGGGKWRGGQGDERAVA